MKRMIFKIGLTVVILVAIYMYYAINQQKSTNLDPQGYEEDRLHDTDLEHDVEREAGDADVEDHTKSQEELKKQRWKSSIHLSVVACGDRGNETVVLLKSAVLFTHTHVVVHIFAEEEIQIYIKAQLDLWPVEYKSRMEYHLYDITFPGTKDKDEWKALFKPCASQRLFIPSLLTEVDSLLYVDTDILFVRPLDDIWAFYKKFNSSQLAALSPEHEDKATGWYNRFARHPYYGELGVNSGVMLMNLTRLRNSTWLDSLMEYYKEYKLKMTWGDQDLINIYFHYHPDQLYVYSCEWNYRPDHCMYMSVCKGAEKDGASVLHGCRRVMHNDKQPAFKAVYEAFRDHHFSFSIKDQLLPTIKQNLKKVADTNCGRVSHIFTKQIEQYVRNMDNQRGNAPVNR